MIGLFGYEVQDRPQRARRSQERCSVDEQPYDLFSTANPCLVVVVPCDLPDFARIWSEFDSIVDFCDDHPDWGFGVLEEFRMAQKAVYRQYGAKRKW